MLETDRETTDRVRKTEEPVYDPDRGSEEVRRWGRSRRAEQLCGGEILATTFIFGVRLFL